MKSSVVEVCRISKSLPGALAGGTARVEPAMVWISGWVCILLVVVVKVTATKRRSGRAWGI